MVYSVGAMAAGFLLDAIFGDPQKMPHPVVWIGRLISFLEKKLRKNEATPKELRRAGAVMTTIVGGACLVAPLGILIIFYIINVWLGFALETFWCYQIFAAKSLKKAAYQVYGSLENEGLEAGRRAVAMIVGRDTESLTEEGVIKATVETVAENTSDGVIAPMLYMAVGGAPLAMLYKAINTMDSMVGYKNQRYVDFGRASAKADDGANYLPARLSALFMIAGTWFSGGDGGNAYRIWQRDRRNHASPNSAQTEAVCAGALRVQLGGTASYFGKIQEKPFIGDSDRPIERKDIKRAVRLMYAASIIGLMVCVLGKMAVLLISGGIG